MDKGAPISREEVLYRRVSRDGLSLDAAGVVGAAFAPHKRDTDGLSCYRALFHTPEHIARVLRTGGTQPSWIIEILASDLDDLGVPAKPDPVEADSRGIEAPGHALIPGINYANAGTNEVIALKDKLAKLASRRPIHGPFAPPTPKNA
ncbi:MAG: hypothetical protein SFY95_01495 [Planctomycetota bacterium]|nr:hypothetical protein [Planctomycetota bacterium]